MAKNDTTTTAPEATEGMKKAGLMYAYAKNANGETVLVIVSDGKNS